MKRKIAILLAAVMTAAALPMNVMASSSNSINRSVSVSVDDFIDTVYLKIQPNDEVLSNESIEISITNAEFVTEEKNEDYKNDNGKYFYYDNYEWSGGINTQTGGAYDWDSAIRALGTLGETTLMNDGTKLWGNENDTLPIRITRNSKKTIDVDLFPISTARAGKDNANGTKPYYYIPIVAKATDEGDIQIRIDANETNLSGGGTYTIATSTDSDGSTTSTIDEVDYFEDGIYLEDITVKENVKGSFDLSKNDGIIKLRLSGGFVFDPVSKQDGLEVAAGINLSFNTVAATTKDQNGNTRNNNFTVAPGAFTVNEDELEIDLKKVPGLSAQIPTAKASSIKISGVKVVNDDDDKWGDVNLTISGAGLTKETIKVATRADYGFEMKLEEEVPTIYAGRFSVANDDIDEDDNLAAEFQFAELISGSYLEQRKLEFTVPEGIKIYKYEFNDNKRISNLEAAASIREDGTVLQINGGSGENGVNVTSSSSTDPAEFDVKLWISADADYEGDVAISVKGAGVGEGVVDDLVIAHVATPIKIDSNATVTNMGRQDIKASDIVITEATDGIFLKDEKVYVELDAAFGNGEIGFSDDNDLDYDITGDLEIKNFQIKDGRLEFTVDKTSYTEPSSITIKNVKIGSTRSVPYGGYDLKVYGPAVINNYDEDEVDDVKYPAESEDEHLGYFDTTEAYSFKDYITIKTETGSFDNVVEVTIDKTECVVNGVSYDMGVAPHITNSSTMVPLRFVSIALGVDTDSIDDPDHSDRVVWDNNTKTAILYYGQGTGQKIIKFQAGSNIMLVDGTPISMMYGAVAELKDGRMFVPFRAIGDALGIKVTWDAETRTARYSSY